MTLLKITFWLCKVVGQTVYHKLFRMYLNKHFFLIYNATFNLDPPHRHRPRYICIIFQIVGLNSILFDDLFLWGGISWNFERFFVDGFTMQIPWKPALPSTQCSVFLCRCILSNNCCNLKIKVKNEFSGDSQRSLGDHDFFSLIFTKIVNDWIL